MQVKNENIHCKPYKEAKCYDSNSTKTAYDVANLMLQVMDD